jgi:4-amino-4-deoxy-L-arabinose transferase-like glycosyltransferase
VEDTSLDSAPRWLRFRKSGVTVFDGMLAGGIAFGLGSLIAYAERGFSAWMLLAWFLGLAALSVFFWSRNRVLPRVEPFDLLASAGLAIVFAPVYLISLYRNPIQVSSDEVAIIGVSEHYAEAHGVDPFGVSYYLGRPTMLFMAWGRLGELVGGLDLYHMRLLHALFGLLTIAACYALLRQLLPRWWAVFGSAVVGVCHSMFMISRLAMRENTSILVEVVAFALLLWGLRNRSLLATFWGGVIAGLAFYVYFPSRATMPLWIAFLIVLAFLFRREFPARRIAILGVTGLAGFVLMATPIVVADAKYPHTAGDQPQKDSLMLFKLGRDKQQEWVSKSTFADAYKINVKWGLTAFNNKIGDHGFIYYNPGHGFVDPLTGILLWLGFGVVLIQLVRRRDDEGALFALVSFVILWLSFALVVNKAPNYTRLMVTLPFVGYFVAQGVRWACGRWRSIRYAPAALVSTAIAVIVVWNLAIAKEFIDVGKKEGEAIGSTGRYVAAHKDNPGETFYIATSDAYPYFSFGGTGTALDRLKLFADDPLQVGQPVDPAGLRSFNTAGPFALFMTRDVWQMAADQLAQRYPRGRIRNVTPDGLRVVLEVPS